MTLATCLRKARDQLGELDFDLENDLAQIEDAYEELRAGGMDPQQAAIQAFNEVAEYAKAEHVSLVEELAALAKPPPPSPFRDFKTGDMVRYESAGKGTSGQKTTIEGRILELYETNADSGNPRGMATLAWKKGPATGRQNVYVSRLAPIDEFTNQWQDPESPADLHRDELGAKPPLKDGDDLIIVACCDKKSGVPGKVSAIDRYQGAYYQMLDQVPPGNRAPVLILSARYGFITEGTEIPDYDQQMTTQRAVELANDAQLGAQLEEILGERSFNNVLIAAGKEYRQVIQQFAGDYLTADNITEASGGIGDQRKQIKEWLAENSAPDLVPEPELTSAQIDFYDNMRPVLEEYFSAARGIGAKRLEDAGIKPAGMSFTDWLIDFRSKKTNWGQGGQRSGGTAIQTLSQKDLWPTDDGTGERLRKAMLAAMRAFNKSKGWNDYWLRQMEAGRDPFSTEPLRPEDLISRDETGAPVGPRREDVPDEWIVSINGKDNLRASPPRDLAAFNDTLRDYADRFRAIEDEKQAESMMQRISTGPVLGFWNAKNGKFIGSETSKPDLEAIGRSLEAAERIHGERTGTAKPIEAVPYTIDEAINELGRVDDKQPNTVEGIPEALVEASLAKLNEAATELAGKGIDPRDQQALNRSANNYVKNVATDTLRSLVFIGNELRKMRDGKTFKRSHARRWAEDAIEKLSLQETVSVDDVVPPAPQDRIAKRDEQMGGAAKNAAQLLHAMGLHKKVLEGEDFHKRISNEPYLDLVIERHNDGQGEKLYFTHYIEEGGDQVLDTEAVFEILDGGQLHFIETAVRSLAGESRRQDNAFATTFTRNLINQGFAQAGREIDPELAAELDKMVPRPFTPAKWKTAWRKMTAKNLVAAAKKIGSNATTKADAANAIEQYVMEYRESQLVRPPKEVGFQYGRFTAPDTGMRYILSFNVTRPTGARGQAGLTDKGIKESLAGTIRHFQGQAWKKPKVLDGEQEMMEAGWIFPRWEDMADFIEFVEGRRPIKPESAEDTGYIGQYFKFPGTEELPPDAKSTPQEHVPGLEPETGHQFAKGDNVVLQPGEYADQVDVPGHSEGRITEFDEDIDGLEAAYVDFGHVEVFVPLKALKPRESVQTRRRKRKAKKGYGEKNKLVTKDQYDDLVASLKKDLGKLNSGVDPQTMFKAVQVGIFHIEAGSREFVDWAIEMLDALGEGIRPYLKDIYRSAYFVPGVPQDKLTPLEELDSLDAELAQREAEEFENVVDVPGGNEAGDRGPSSDAAATGPAVEGQPEQAGVGGRTEGPAAGQPRSDTEGDRGLLGTVPDPSGEYADTGLFAEPERSGAVEGDTGSAGPGQRGERGDSGVQPGAGGRGFSPADAPLPRAPGKLDRAALAAAQAKANKLPVKLGDAENIATTLPHLTPAQHGDVLKQERRVEQGKTGMLFTNATGTGKTYTGLGIVNRHQRATGSSEILIVTTSQPKVADWVRDAESMGLDATRLENTTTAGEGIVVTTYANFRQNLELHDRDFTLIVYDESHKIMEGQDSDNATALHAHFAMASHPDHLYSKAYYRIPLLRELEYGRRDFVRKYTAEEMESIVEGIRENGGPGARVPEGDALKELAKDNLNVRWREENQEQYRKGHKQARELENSPEFQALADTTFATFLSATPFPYHKNLHYGNHYLFDYPNTDNATAYNDPNSGRDAFLMANLGYHMKNGKLNRPEAEVNVDLLERQLHERLKEEGAVSGRAADFGFDYSRQFPRVNPELGEALDQGIMILRGWSRDGEYLSESKAEELGVPHFRLLPQAVHRDGRFGYIPLRQMMEAIKARELNERVQKHLAMGRKVVVFHDYRKLHEGHPFHLENLAAPRMPTDAMQIAAQEELQAEIALFNAHYSEFRKLPLSGMKSVVDYIESEFNDQAAFINGSQTDSAKKNALEMFKRDDSGVNILVVQRQSGKEGIDAHDITGTHQRALIDMGLPTHPTDALQTEGRIYRFGVQSNAVIEYPVLGVNFEQIMFAQRAAERSRTAENLAMGNAARNIEIAFREGYLNASVIEPSAEQGTGGQQGDRRDDEIDAFDQAITYYYARQRNTNRRDQREGADYFATPEPVGLKMVEWANPKGGERGIEPSAGHGAIARFFPEDTRNVFVEPSPKLGAEISLLSHGEFEAKRFEDIPVESKFDFMVMNPPYGQGGATARDHVAKAMNHLTNGGRIVALIPEGPAADKKFDELIYGKEGEAEQLRERIKKAKKGTSLVEQRQRLRQLEEFFIMGEVGLPQITFKRAGTAVKTRILILDRYSNPEEVPYQRERVNLEAEEIPELFDRIKDMEMPARGEVTQSEERPEIAIEDDKVTIGQYSARVEKSWHKKKAKDIWLVKMKGNVPRDIYLELRAAAEEHAGYWSRFTKSFVFEDEQDAYAMLSSYAEIISGFDSVREQPVEYKVKEDKGGDGQLDLFTTKGTKVKLTDQRVSFKKRGTLVAPKHVSTPETAAYVLDGLGQYAQEHFATLVTDKYDRPLAVIHNHVGTVDGASVDPRYVLGAIAGVENAAKAWFGHNHPSGRAVLSSADHGITKRLHQLLRGTGIEGQGILAITPEGFASYYNPNVSMSQIDYMPYERSRPVKAIKIPEFERVLPRAGVGEVPVIENPESAIRTVNELFPNKTGLMFLNSQHAVVGWQEMPDDMMRKLRTDNRDTGAALLYREWHESNAYSIIVVTGDDKAARNVESMAAQLNSTVLDSLVRDEVTGLLKSHNQAGKMNSALGQWYSKRAVIGSKPPVGLPLEKVQEAAGQFLEGLGNRVDIRISAVATQAERFPDVQERVRGAFYAKTGELVLVAENIGNKRQAIETMRHEILAHYGLNLFEPKVKKAILAKIAASESMPGMAELFTEIRKDNPNLAGDALAQAEEVFARLAEEPREGLAKVWDEIVTMVNKALRKLGLLKGVVSKAELRELVASIAEGIRSGKLQRTRPGRSGPGRFSQERRSTTALYPYLVKAIEEAPQKRATGQQWLGMLRKRGVKQEELAWTGVDEYLANSSNQPVERDFLRDLAWQRSPEIRPIYQIIQADLDEAEISVDTMEGESMEVDPSREDLQAEIDYWLHDNRDELEREWLAENDMEIGDDPDVFEYPEDYTPTDEDLEPLAEQRAEAMYWENPGYEKSVTILGMYDGEELFEGEYVLSTSQGDNAWTAVDDETGYYVASGEHDDLIEQLQEIVRKSTWEVAEQRAQNAKGVLDPSIEDIDIREAEYADYALPGAADADYREILLQLQNMPETRTKHFSGGHWGDEDVMMHVRVTSRLSGNSEPVLLIEEIQSDWHQEGRKSGYEKAADVQKIYELERQLEEVTKLLNEFKDRWREIVLTADRVVNDISDRHNKIHNEHAKMRAAGDNPELLDSWNVNAVLRSVTAWRNNTIGSPMRSLDDTLRVGYESLENLARDLDQTKEQASISRLRELSTSIEKIKEPAARARLRNQEISGKINALSRGIPDAPLKKTWHEAAFRWAVWEAAREGAKVVAWTSGETQADRYSLSQVADKILLIPEDAGMVEIQAWQHQTVVKEESVERAKLEEYVGAEIAKKFEAGDGLVPVKEYQVIATNSKGEEWNKGNFSNRDQAYAAAERQQAFEVPDREGYQGAISHRVDEIDAGYSAMTIEGDDLRVGGHGMMMFYDRMLVNYAKKFAKKFGAKVKPGRVQHPSDDRYYAENETTEVWTMEITDAMNETARKDGFPMFQKTATDNYGEAPKFKKVSSDRTMRGKAKQANQALNWMHEKLDSFGSIGTLPGREEYLKRRYLTLGQISDIEDHAKRLHDTLAQAGEEAPTVFKYLTDAEASPSMIENEATRKAAVQAKAQMMVTGQKLVDRGLLSEEVYEQNKGKYLPRLYLMHLLKDQDIIRMATGKMPSDMGYLKKRKDIPEEVRKLILGEIRDPSFLASRAYGQQERDMAILDWLSDIAMNPEWILQQSVMQWSWTDREGETHTRKVTPFWLANEAKRMEAQIPHLPVADQGKATEIMQDMKQAVADALSDEQLVSVPEGFKQIPNKPRFGVMRGLVVRKEIHDDIIGSMNVVSGEQSIAEQILGTGGYATKFTQLWKWMKVAANPPAQVRNFVSNGVLLHLSGVPFHRVPKRVIQAIRQIIAAGKGEPRSKWKGFYVAKKYGVTESTFAAQELFRMERDLLDLESKNAGKFSWVQAKLLWSKIMDKASDAYQFSEQIFKTAKIIDALEAGVSEGDAALEAQKWLFDYSLVTPSMRYLRNAPVGVPFLTFYMKVAPRLLETMVTAPWRFAPYLAIPYAMSAMLEQAADVDDDDVEALRLALPKWLQERGHAYFLPMKDDQGRWFAADFGYFLPWTMWTEMAKQVGKGEISDAMLSTGLLGGPVPDLIAAAKTNRDPFTQREIVNKYDDPAKQLADLMNYLYKLSAPTWLTEYGVAGHMKRALSNTVDKYGQPKSTVPQAALRLFGVNTYAVDPEHSRSLNIQRARFEISEMVRRRNRQARDKNLTKADREELLTEWNERIKRRVEDLRQYAVESEVHPNLR